MHRSPLLLALAAACCVQAAAAGTITAYNRATFQTALASAGLAGQNFDALATGPITTVGGVTYQASGGTAIVTSAYLTTTPDNGLGSSSVGFFLPSESATISFASAITAFAIDINTFAPSAGAYSVTLNDGSGATVSSVFDVFPGTATGQFIGFTDSAPFTSVVLSAVGAAPFSYTLDTLVYGQASAVVAVPEPHTAALMLLGLAAIGTLIARRSRPR